MHCKFLRRDLICSAEHGAWFPFLGNDKRADDTSKTINTSELLHTACRYLNEDPNEFSSDVKKAFRIGLMNELLRSLDFSEERLNGRGLHRISIDITRSSRGNARPSRIFDGIFNLRSEGIDLDGVLVNQISENNSELISVALRLMRRNRRFYHFISFSRLFTDDHLHSTKPC